eukprot:TRINITY_DN10959_c0_g1_i5.p1 TRINITY_DN10959_c0_g1~~TRINITY_DN10959_c0_g1_i5.p1  ORF type:complete len:579 (+),score=128.12 TRINITY_DN10959_c0_g1_i5:24-1739(+)
MTATARVIVVFGAPGSGKGTQCKWLACKFGFVHLSTGDVFRDAVARGTALGAQVRPYVERGDFVPDELVVELVAQRLQQPDAVAKGVLLDGYPRTRTQARALAEQVERFLLLQAPDDVCAERVLGRRTDPVTGDIYHLKLRPPPHEVSCRLVQRPHDNDERAVRLRLQAYHRRLGQILQYFSGKIQLVDSNHRAGEVHKAVGQCLAKHFAPAPAPAVPADATCAVCHEQPADHLALPCAHRCGCAACITAARHCPVCNGPVESSVPIFDQDEPEDAADDGWGDDMEGEAEQEQEQQQVSVTVEPCAEVKAGTTVNVAVVAQAKDLRVRPPVDVVCVVDISGSMGEAAAYQDEHDAGAVVRDAGITVLDLVSHCVRAVAHMLGSTDRLALVIFDDNAETVCPLREMTEEGRAAALAATCALEPRGSTNIWAGLQAGMDTLRTADKGKERKKFVLLLTDGQPNVVPPRGHIAALREYAERYRLEFQLDTFGFGYGLDSKLLADLAAEGGGTFAFCPDAKVVGTCFVDAVANASSTLAQVRALRSFFVIRGDQRMSPHGKRQPIAQPNSTDMWA